MNMNPGIPTINIRKLSNAIAAATLMGIAGQASAVPVSIDVIYQCNFPIAGIEPVSATVSSDMPGQVLAGELTDVFPLTADIQINTNVHSFLDIYYLANLEGTAVVNGRLETPGRVINLDPVNLNIPNTEVPLQVTGFSLMATGEIPRLLLEETDVGMADVFIGGLTLEMKSFYDNGEPGGEFTSDCTLAEEQNPILHSFEVCPPDTIDCDTPPESKIAVTPTEIDFGAVRAGMVSEAQKITITNEGGAILGINSIDLTGIDGATEFSEVSNNCTTLEANKSCTVSYRLAPSTDGPREAKVTIDSDAPNNDEIGAITLTGEGQIEETPVPEPSPETLDFGYMEAGNSATKTITIVNSGTGTLTFSYIAISANDFQITDAQCITAQLATNEACTVDVRFVAVEENESTGELLFATNGGDVSVDLMGSNKTGPGPEIYLELEGKTFIARSEGTLPITGSIAAMLYLEDFSIEADLALDPTEANFAVIKGWNSWNSTAQVEFEQTRLTTGTLDGGKLKTSSEMYVKIPQVTVPIFGLYVPIGGGDECRTSEPSVIELESLDGEKFSPSTGGRVTGTYALADLENCGWLTDLINGYMAGPGNTLDLNLTVVK